MKFLAICLIAAVICSSASADLHKFKKFRNIYNKHYHNETHAKERYANFLKAQQRIDECNSADHTHECGHNDLSDLHDHEFAAMQGGKEPTSEQLASANEVVTFENSKRQLPASVDWRQKSGVVTPVKQQGTCGSCYIFAATAALESQMAIKKKVNTGWLSEQQALDCLQTGCGGGWPGDVSNYQKNGAQTAASKPYTGRIGQCSRNFQAIAKTNGYNRVNGGDNNLAQAIAQVGPVTVSILSTSNLQNYRGGIFTDNQCRNDGKTNHVVTAVGFDANSWIIKNSWGTGWGENGYARFSRRVQNICSISSYPSYPLV